MLSKILRPVMKDVDENNNKISNINEKVDKKREIYR